MGTFSAVVAYKGHNGAVWDLDVGPSGHYFVSGSADRTVRLWTTQGMQPLRMFVGHLSDVDVSGGKYYKYLKIFAFL
jgi:transcription initiation factor TFIID subunit 5